MKLVKNKGILPKGFECSGLSAGIKKSGKKDIALFYSASECVTAALVTVNKIKAAPLEVSKDIIKKGRVRAVIVNSGNANCMTGSQGFKDAASMTKFVERDMRLAPHSVIVSSTGYIGKTLPMDKIKKSVPKLVSRLNKDGLKDAASAIMTTDTFPKYASLKAVIAGKDITISGVAKGSGMIAPNLKSATMLAYIFSDARITSSAAKKAIAEAVESSFNSITVDGCMSTNDTVVFMANGKAENRIIKEGSSDFRKFSSCLKEICLELAKMIVRDGEGATKFIKINVAGSKSLSEAKRLAFSVANSNLFKCAMFGSDPNWGRIMAALGSVDSQARPEKIDVMLNKRAVVKKGAPVAVNKKGFLKSPEITVDVNLNMGKYSASVYTSDLSYGYVRINTDYN